jgi:hypothetical protein
VDEMYVRPDRAEIAARVRAGLAAERAAEPMAVPVPEVRRCRACGYLETAVGHRVACLPSINKP